MKWIVLGLARTLKKYILKSYKNELRLYFHCYILIPRKCLRQNLFQHTGRGGGPKLPPCPFGVYASIALSSCWQLTSSIRPLYLLHNRVIWIAKFTAGNLNICKKVFSINDSSIHTKKHIWGHS